MKVYIDLIVLLNFYLDFLILITTSITLKRNASIKRILLGTLFGSISILFLFWSVSSLFLFFFKIFLAILMNVITFGYKDFKYLFHNLSYFYMISVILGGFLYYLNLEFSYTHIGLIFINRKVSIPAIFLFILSPIILYIYYRQSKYFKSTYHFIYSVTIAFKKNKSIKINGYLDTGNKLIDPVTNKPIILIQKGLLNVENENILYVPYNCLNHHNLLKCVKPLYIEIKGKKYKNYLVGLSDKKFHLEGVECILNQKLMEEMI